MSTGKAITLFKARDELANLIWPLIIFIVLALHFFLYGNLSKTEIGTIQLLSGILLLNTTHNVFTLMNIFLIPEGREMVRQLNENSRPSLYWKWTFIYIAIFLYFLFSPQFSGYVHFGEVRHSLISALVLGLYATYYHTIRQIEGISMAYNTKAKATNNDMEHSTDAFAKHINIEKKLFFVFLAISALGFGLNYMVKLRMINFLFALSLIVYFSILINSYKFPYRRGYNKIYYQLRLLFFCLAIKVPYFIVAIPCFHGVEYLFVTRKIFSNSKRAEKKTGAWIKVIVISSCLLVSALALFRFGRGGYGSELKRLNTDFAFLIDCLAALSMSLAFMHFYLDGQIFNMKKEEIRSKMGPLISK